MSIAERKRFITPAEYLDIERAAPFRSEYFRGEMFAMAGGTPPHSLIKMNLGTELCTALKGKPCTAYDSDLRVRIAATGLYTYPDFSVICGEPEFDDAHKDTVLNPTLIAEVLSESTEGYDRGKKFNHYRKIATLQEYVLVCQDQPQVKHFLRSPDGTWNLTVVNGLDKELLLPSIGVTLKLREVFDKMGFAEPA